MTKNHAQNIRIKTATITLESKQTITLKSKQPTKLKKHPNIILIIDKLVR
jgi:hypothetical protein